MAVAVISSAMDTFTATVDDPLLRVGVLVASPADYRLLLPVLEAICDSGIASLFLLIERPEASSLQTWPRPQSVYERWDARRNRSNLEAVRSKIAALLGPVPVVRLRDYGALDDDECARILEFRLDVIISDSSDWSTGLGHCARCGVWSIGLEDSGGAPLSSRAFYRQTKGNPVARVRLTADAGADQPHRMLGRAVLRQPTTLSLTRALQVQGRSAAELVTWTLRQLRERGWPDLVESARVVRLSSDRRTIRPSPFCAWIAALGGQIGKTMARYSRPNEVREWRIGIRPVRPERPWEGHWEDFNWLRAPVGHYFADPFLYQHDGRTWLFVEDYDYRSAKGSICCGELTPAGTVINWHPVLDLPHHLSFPFVFEESGTIYLVPESSAAGTVDLYRCTRFPWDWVYVRTLWSAAGLDTVPYRGPDECWYFFTSLQSSAEVPPQLLLFTAPDLFSPWSLHPASPLSLDVRYARNGGRIIEHCDRSGVRRLYRVSQDGSGKYGSRLHFHEILELTPERYSERLAGTRLPPGESDGAHQYERMSEWEAVDATANVETSQLWQVK